MPSWKKVVVSGSSPTLNDITLSGDARIAVAKRLYFGGSDHTYISEDADDRLRFFVGGAEFMRFTESTGNSFSIYEDVYIPDDKKIHIGTGNDLKLYHDGSNSSVENHTGNLYIDNNTNDGEIIFRADDNSGGMTSYFALVGSQLRTTFYESVRVADSKELTVGDGDDLAFSHNGTNSFAVNSTGDLTIQQNANDKDIILSSDDGSGGVTPYITLDGSTTTVEVAKNLNVSANISGSQIEASGDIIAFGSSDERLKDNITTIFKPMDKINKIGGYKFTWNDKQDTYLGKDVGVLAQEIEAVLPEVVTTRATGYKAVKYEKIVPLLIEGIKELDKKIKHIEENCECLNK